MPLPFCEPGSEAQGCRGVSALLAEEPPVQELREQG